MKIQFTAALVSVLALTSFAKAADSNPPMNERHLFEFNFQCSFAHPTPTPTVTVGRGGHEILAAAQVFAFVRDHSDWTDNVTTDHNLRNKLAVLKDGELVYADGANLESRREFVEIEGLNGGPEIFIKRHDSQALSPEWMSFEAYINLHGERIDGECQVHAEPVHGMGAPTLQ